MKSPLFAAIERRDIEGVKRVLESGAEVNTADDQGKSALMLAASMPENYAMVKFLVESGADVLAGDVSGKSVLDYVFEPPKPPEHHENAYEAWIHCEEHFTYTYLSDEIKKAKPDPEVSG